MFPASSNEDFMMNSSSHSRDRSSSSLGGAIGHNNNNNNNTRSMMMAGGDFDNELLALEPTPLSDVIHQQHTWQHQNHQQHHHHPFQPQQQQPLHCYLQQDEAGGGEGLLDEEEEPTLSAADFFDECGLFATSSHHHHHHNDYRNNNNHSVDEDDEKDDDNNNIHRSKRRRSHSNKPGVQFSCEAMIHPSPREVDETLTAWYTREELASFKKERKDIVRALKRVNFDLSKFDCSAHCLRGLEAYSSIRFNKLMQHKREQVIKTVLAEQARQRGFAMFDASSLREASVPASEWARGRALELGLEDAKELGLLAVPTSPSSSSEEDPTNFAWGHESGISQTSTTPSLCSSVTSSHQSDGSPAMTMGKSSNFLSPTMTMGKSAAMAKYIPSPSSRGDFILHVHPTAGRVVGGAGTMMTTVAASGRGAYDFWSPRTGTSVLPHFSTATTTTTTTPFGGGGVHHHVGPLQAPPSASSKVVVAPPPSVVARELATSLSLVDTTKPR